MVSKAISRSNPMVIALAGSAMVAASMGIGRFAYTPLLPAMQVALGWTVAQAGDVASANYLGYMLGAMIATALVHQPQRRRWLLAGMLFSALTTFLGALIKGYVIWLSLRFLSGVASAFCLVIGTAMVVDIFVRHARPQLGSLYFSGVAAGIVVSVIVIECVKLAGYSVFAQWGLLGILAFIVLVAAWYVLGYLPDMASDKAAGTKKTTRASSASLIRLIIAYGFFGFGYVVTATFIVAIARDLDNSVVLEPVTWIVVGLVGGPSLFVWQHLSGRIGVGTALRIAYGIEAAGVLLAGMANSAFAVILGGALLGGTFMAITSLGFTAARQVAGSNQDRAIAWMTVSFGFGQLLGPAVAGRLAEMTGSFAAPSALASGLLVMGMLLIDRKR